MRREHFLISGIVGALSISAVLGAQILAPRQSVPKQATIGNTLNSSAPTDRVPQPLTDTPVVSATLGPTTDTIRYYESQTGKAFQINLATHQATVLSDKKLPGFSQTIWAADKEQVMSVFTDPAGIAFRYFDYRTGKSARIGTSVTSAAFSPNGQRIAFIQSDTEQLTVFVSAVDGTGQEKILNTRATDAKLAWPTSDSLILSTRRQDQSGYTLTRIGMDGSLTPMLSGLQALESLWSSDGSRLLYSYFEEGKGIQLWSLDLATTTLTALNIPTSAHKCAWHQDTTTITCGVPHNTSLSRDTLAATSATLDDIVTINTLSSEQQTVYAAQTGSYIGVIDPLVSSSGSSFVFTNLFDQHLYEIPLN